jgi:cephalosporin hydroxylase
MNNSAKIKKLAFGVFALLVLAGEAYLLRHLIVSAITPGVAILSNIVYYEAGPYTWNNTTWLGVPLEKYPTDLFAYQEIIFETKPDVLIEAGTYKGGSAYYFASLFDLLGKGRVITMDIEDHPEKPKHPRIEYLLMSSVSDETVRRIKSEIKPEERVMVSLDSNHVESHVFKELQIYSSMVTKGCYLVVEDTNINGHPVYPSFGPGPMEAVEKFMANNENFEADRSRERLMLTVSPRGYLRRLR